MTKNGLWPPCAIVFRHFHVVLISPISRTLKVFVLRSLTFVFESNYKGPLLKCRIENPYDIEWLPAIISIPNKMSIYSHERLRSAITEDFPYESNDLRESRRSKIKNGFQIYNRNTAGGGSTVSMYYRRVFHLCIRMRTAYLYY